MFPPVTDGLRGNGLGPGAWNLKILRDDKLRAPGLLSFLGFFFVLLAKSARTTYGNTVVFEERSCPR